MEIPLKAQVECTDGICGQSVYVLINPIAEQVTHLVVQETLARHTEYVVPVDCVKSVIAGTIQLCCGRAELQKMEPFVQTRFIREKWPQSDGIYGRSFRMTLNYYWPYVMKSSGSGIQPVEHLQIPPGELAIHRGTRVEATDGTVGHVDEFVVNSDNGAITHLVMREGHPWAPRDVIIPVSELSEARQDTVYLKLDKHQVESLPTFPVHRRWD